MLTPRKARRLEMYFEDRWVDVSRTMRENSGVTINYGSASHDRSVPPAKLSAVLDNSDERYSRRNPLSANYGRISPNLPVRLTLGLSEDWYGRTVLNSWGTSTSGDHWAQFQAFGTAADFGVTSAGAFHIVQTVSTSRLSYLPQHVHRDVEVAVTCSLSFSNVTGNDIEPANLVLRGMSTSDYLMVRVVITSAEQFKLKITTASGTDYGSGFVTLDTPYTGQAFRVRAQAEGGTVRAKLWIVDTSVPDSDGEPDTWDVEAEVPLSVAGWVGVRSGVAGGNTNIPVTFTYRDFEVRSPRFIGEASAMVPEWNLAETDRTVKLDVSGVLQRLQKGKAPLKSTLRRTLPTLTALVAYWPMEDGSEADAFASAMPTGGVPMTIDPAGDQTLATFSDFACSQALPVANTVTWHGPVESHMNNGKTQLRFLMSQSDTGVPNGSPIVRMWLTGGSLAWVDIRGWSATDMHVVINNGVSDVVSMLLGFNANGKSGRLSVDLQQNGSSVDWGVWFFEVGAGFASGVTGSLSGHSFGIVSQVSFGIGFDLDGTAIGHATVENWVTSIFDVIDQLHAYDGEPAATRMNRLCFEEGIPLSISGAYDPDAKMGPQGPDTLINSLKACAKLDMGILGESRGKIGLKYRTRLGMLNQSPVAEVDRSAGQLSAPFAPTDDDRLTLNDVTAERVNGSSARVEQITGPFSTADPPAGAGRYDTSEEFNAHRDTQLPDLAGWMLSLGTVDEHRVPAVVVDLAVRDVAQDTALVAGILSMDVGDRIIATGLGPLGLYDGVDQIAHGYTETINVHSHTLQANTFPASPYNAFTLGDSVLGRLDSGSSFVDTAFSPSATSFLVTTEAADEYWTTSGTDFPLDVMIGGERIRISSISGSGPVQTFTVSAGGRALNGVAKAHVVGESVHIATPVRLA